MTKAEIIKAMPVLSIKDLDDIQLQLDRLRADMPDAAGIMSAIRFRSPWLTRPQCHSVFIKRVIEDRNDGVK